MAEAISVYKMACARIPTDVGDFTLCLYHNNLDDKEHLALIAGDAAELASGETQPPVLVRVHSECYTGDVLGSRRCDCGPQLAAAMQLIAEEGRGIILYLRQEGRGIGLLDKLRAYNLQDVGYDTVDANFLLGHQADVRDYRVAAEMLKDLGVYSMRLMTNNPDKIAGLERRGLRVTERVPLQTAVHAENAHYLDTKVRRMRHLMHLDFPSSNGAAGAAADLRRDAMLRELTTFPAGRDGRPFVTLTYAQSLDGSIAARRGEQTLISGPQAARLTHQLRAAHDAILVGIGTVLSDDPRLTVRHAPGRDPQPVIVDSQLRFPLGAKLISDGRRPWIVTTEAADAERQAALEAAGARIIRLPAEPDGQVDLRAMLEQLGRLSVRSLMVEGGAAIITSFLLAGLADRLVLTIAPRLIGGLNAVERRDAQNGRVLPPLLRPRYQPLGDDMILYGDLDGE